MQNYSNGQRKIMATERAFQIIYKDQGFVSVVDDKKDEENLESLKVDELKEKAKEKNIDGYEDMKKTELISALTEDKDDR